MNDFIISISAILIVVVGFFIASFILDKEIETMFKKGNERTFMSEKEIKITNSNLEANWIGNKTDPVLYTIGSNDIRFTKQAISTLNDFLEKHNLRVVLNRKNRESYLYISSVDNQEVIAKFYTGVTNDIIYIEAYAKFRFTYYIDNSDMVEIIKRCKEILGELNMDTEVVDKGLENMTSELSMKVTYTIDGREVDIKEILEGYEKYLKIKEQLE